MFGLALIYTLGFAAVVTAVVYGALKLLRRQSRPRIGRIFAVALATWLAGLVVYATGLLDPYLSDSQATILGLASALVIAGVVGFRTAIPATLP